MSKLKGIKDKIFSKYQCDILKRAFSVDCEGMCVRSKIAIDALRGAIEDTCEICSKPRKVYDFWGQEISIDET